MPTRWVSRVGARCALLATAACATSHMKVPTAAESSPQWPLVGYTEASFREPDFTLDGRSVRDVHRVSAPNVGHGASARQPHRYRFELASTGAVQKAECSETTDPRKLWMLRFGEGEVHLECSCREGEQTRATVSLTDGKGSIRLGTGATYKVETVRQEADGDTIKEALGYSVHNEQGAGAIERTGSGRMWPPRELDARSATDLACGYAALLLYRPKS